MATSLTTRVRAAFKRQIQTRLWGMDIDPSAWVHPSALVDRTFPKGIHIGPNTIVGEEAVILSHDFSRGLYLHTRIGAGCNLGPRAIVMPGVTIGRDCIIAPGALVNRDVPERSMAIGNPARIEPREWTADYRQGESAH